MCANASFSRACERERGECHVVHPKVINELIAKRHFDMARTGEPREEVDNEDDADDDDNVDDDPGEATSRMSQGFRPQREPFVHREPKLLPLSTEDDIEHFLTTFERMACVCRWPKNGWAVRLVQLLMVILTDNKKNKTRNPKLSFKVPVCNLFGFLLAKIKYCFHKYVFYRSQIIIAYK